MLVPAGLLVGAVAVVVLATSGGGGGGSGTDEANVLKTGARAPAVALPSTAGGTVDLSVYRGKRNVLLYFYEHAG